ncbi:MAG: hypothetical protein LQ344_007784 [Seirophora lacunosa]|nr:MAG: hypothetical protein LQ344_007784 [Seirophora lacunosa]
MPTSHVPDHCEPTTALLASISTAFHTCVPTPLALVSTALGVCSILSWLFAQLPQIIKNHKLKSASGLSIYFLAEWLLGDLTNLLGALLTRQAAWQVVIAAYYVTVDVCLVVQYFWYAHYKPWPEERLSDLDLGYDDRGDGTSGTAVVGVLQSPDATSASRGTATCARPTGPANKSSTEVRPVSSSPKYNLKFSWAPSEKAIPSNSSCRTIRRTQTAPSLGFSPNTLLVVSLVFAVLSKASPLHTLSQDPTTSPESSDAVETAGRILSWISTTLYLGSRLPQIFKNHRRRSTSGLSPALFIAAFFGNFFYSASLLTNPLAWDDSPPYGLHGWADEEGSDRVTWLTLATPFFLGAAGVLFMDAIIGVQFLIFGESEAASTIVVMTDERGRGHWRKVSGWMRGWIPSPGPRTPDEDQRPLLSRATSSHHQHSYGGAS